MKISILISMALIFYSYVAYIWIKYGIQRSISASYYKLPKDLKWLFTAFCFLFGMGAAMMGGLDKSILMFLSGVLVCFIGVTPNFKDKGEKWIHMIAAYGSGILSQLAIVFDYKIIPLALITLTCFMFLMILKRSVKEIWWIEIITFTTVILAFLK